MVLSAAVFACQTQNAVNPKLSNEMPDKILWAWERNENLSFLKSKDFGVAFLAQTFILQNDEVIFRPRRQPLEVPDDIYIIAVTRIETGKNKGKQPNFRINRRNKLLL